jgi:hypothetical protein
MAGTDVSRFKTADDHLDAISPRVVVGGPKTGLSASALVRRSKSTLIRRVDERGSAVSSHSL